MVDVQKGDTPVHSISGINATQLYCEAMNLVFHFAKLEDSRAGRVYAVPGPVCLTLTDPTKRVLFAPIRRPNPVFHVMEAIWMLAGEDNVDWLLQFNKGIGQFAEDDGTIHGAYGKRWRRWFNLDQISVAVQALQDDLWTRQCVIAMWDPDSDWGDYKDRPCNTHIYFRMTNSGLDMTVCNRSNDLIWGALGSNIVHMTMLHEFVAATVGVPLGVYRVLTNNLHVYRDLYAGSIKELIIEGRFLPTPQVSGKSVPLVSSEQTPWQFIIDCEQFIRGMGTQTEWFTDVARPMLTWWEFRLPSDLELINDVYWRESCRQWGEKK